MHTTIELPNETLSLHDVVQRVMQGEEIVITEAGTPLVRMVPINPPNILRRTAGLSEGAATIADDFDEPLPNTFWLGND